MKTHLEHPLREPARSFIDAARDGLVQARTTPEVIQEFADVRARRRDRYDPVLLAAAFGDLMSPLQVVTPEHLSRGLELRRQVPALGAFDAVLAALAIDADVPLCLLIAPSDRYRACSGGIWPSECKVISDQPPARCPHTTGRLCSW